MGVTVVIFSFIATHATPSSGFGVFPRNIDDCTYWMSRGELPGRNAVWDLGLQCAGDVDSHEEGSAYPIRLRIPL